MGTPSPNKIPLYASISQIKQECSIESDGSESEVVLPDERLVKMVKARKTAEVISRLSDDAFPTLLSFVDEDRDEAILQGEIHNDRLKEFRRILSGSLHAVAMSPITSEVRGSALGQLTHAASTESSPGAALNLDRALISPLRSTDQSSLRERFSRVDTSDAIADDFVDNDGESESCNECAEASDEERRRREEEESEALARQLMAEEAIASYSISADFLRNNADQYSEDDLAALRAAMAEEDPTAEEEVAEGELEESVSEQVSEDLSYDTLLRLGERIGDVKQERWEMQAARHIEKLPLMTFKSSITNGKDNNDSAVKCLVCQSNYEKGEILRSLPCKHCFHVDCVDQWLSKNEICPYCRLSILKDTA